MSLCKILSTSKPDYFSRKLFIFTSCCHPPSRAHVINLIRAKHQSAVRPFPLSYDPRIVEEGRYAAWEKNDAFKPKISKTNQEVFSLILPPPNVTGTLHLGHAYTVTLQDILCRWHRMQGHPVVWVPGFDHAGIATQVVVEKKLQNERNVSRHDLGREKFIQEVMLWKDEKIDVIKSQLKRLGASLDWSRESFTMDEKQCIAVREAVIRLFEAGALYRGEMLVNWCCFLQSAISDIEVETKEVTGPTKLNVPGYDKPVTFGLLYDFAYKFSDREGEVIVSTTRIETMPGDVAVAVHPNDQRYQNLEGAMLYHPFRRCNIPLIYDEFVDPNVGTGAVKITPAHNQTDFEVAKRHNLPIIPVINDEGRMLDFQKFQGLKRFDARQPIIEALKEEGLYRQEKPHKMALPCCSRSGDVIEHLIRPQWFLNLDEVTERITTALNKNEIEVEPASCKKLLLDWFTTNHRPWCISRQMWWGHQLPLYLAKNTWVAAHSCDEAKQKFKEKLKLTDEETENLEIRQDEDVLDTWFSSGLLPFSVFGWPNNTKDLQQFYPLSLMETGNDILGFWVARMLILGLFATDTLPFKKIMLHGMITDSQGRKMSKTRGNVIDPQHIINGVTLKTLNKELEKSMKTGYLSEEEFKIALVGQKRAFPKGIMECGADALRLTLSAHEFRNSFIKFDWTECEKNRKFGNKLLQVCKFIHQRLESLPDFGPYTGSPQSYAETWILSRLADCVETVNNGLSCYNFHRAVNSLLRFLVQEFCDVFVEVSKPVLHANNDVQTDAAASMCHTLLFCLETYLRLLAPFMPFLSEELYSLLFNGSVHDTKFPTVTDYSKFRDLDLDIDFIYLLEIVKGIRRSILLNNTSFPDRNFEVVIKTANSDLISDHLDLITNLSRGSVRTSLAITISDTVPLKHYFMDPPIDEDTSIHLLMNLENFDLLAYENKLLASEESLKKSIGSQAQKLLKQDNFEKPSSKREKLQDQRKMEESKKQLELLSNYLIIMKEWTKKGKS